MKEKRRKDKKHSKKHKKNEEKQKRYRSSSSSSSESEEWVEKKPSKQLEAPEREDWMSMTGMLRTYTKEDIKPKREEKNKNHIDSYNPATSSRELNPYWKQGGSGLPQTPESFRKSRQFLKPPDDDDDYYKKSCSSKDYGSSKTSHEYSRYSQDSKSESNRNREHRSERDVSSREERSYYHDRSHNWKKSADDSKSSVSKTNIIQHNVESKQSTSTLEEPVSMPVSKEKSDSLYMSDEKLNKLAAKVVKAEIMGDLNLYKELKAKLEAAREYRKQNPNAKEDVDDERVMLISTNSSGNSRPLMNTAKGDARSKGNKRKADTHSGGERTKYFGNDDKYNLAQMFEQEKYGNNYDDEAQLANIASKHKNPNDDLEDIFMDDISKNRNEAKDRDAEKQRAINQHVRIERSLEGCEYCVDSKNMLKHLMVSCGNKTYLALPSKQSLVTGHCIITTVQHATCVTALDEDVWAEILTFRKALTRFFNTQGKDVVFFEMATKLHRFPHMVLNCVPLPRDVGDTAAIYFKKALLECETEWSMNKKVVDLKGKDIRKGVPKGLPYFWIDFGMDPGFAHVIEDQQLFPKMFGEEIIGGILDLDHHLWKNPKRECGDIQRKKVLEFIKEWKPFEPTFN
ncbi:CWF19-like protein 2 homolog [Ostrinia furnacalis]|uniref:CWF19-like protein 2 homolog n=1 Tax=Ostrinia furnacalis TaxID=93504 RepID=UPI00103B89E4|nr:CWF19-like protein 2 homolog [Ostrinia furnacalis]